MINARDVPVAESDSRLREARALGARVRTMRGELEFFKRLDLRNCDIEAINLIEVHAQGKGDHLVKALHRDAVSSYDSICRSCD